MTPRGPQDAAKHTPGPWFVYEKASYFGVRHATGLPGNHGTIATCTKPVANAEANARLIASAPELYELAKAVVDHFEGTDARLGEWARELVAKAEGGA